MKVEKYLIGCRILDFDIKDKESGKTSRIEGGQFYCTSKEDLTDGRVPEKYFISLATNSNIYKIVAELQDYITKNEVNILHDVVIDMDIKGKLIKPYNIKLKK